MKSNTSEDNPIHSSPDSKRSKQSQRHSVDIALAELLLRVSSMFGEVCPNEYSTAYAMATDDFKDDADMLFCH